MLSQRAARQSLMAIQRPSMTWAPAKFASPAIVATGKSMQMRPTSSTTDTTDPTKILAQQRLNRPVAPHLSIYRPQITWYGSAMHRITGSALSGGLYVFATAYLVAPLLGWHLDSASLAAAFGALPLVVKLIIKLGVALPFTFHSFNGVRHLIWDLGRNITNKKVITSGWTVVGLSVTSALLLALL